jgi:hypothetical protein
MKKGLLGLLVLGGLLVAPSGAMAAGGGFCHLKGTANFTTPLTMTDKAFGYSFHGTLGGDAPCVGSDPGITGVVTAGETFNGFPEPRPSGKGSCGSSTTSGISFVQWSDGKVTIVDYDTTGAAAAVALTGTVLNSYTLKSADGLSSLTVRTTRYAGGYSGGPLAFEPPDPTACNAAGVTTAGIDGLLGTGGP